MDNRVAWATFSSSFQQVEFTLNMHTPLTWQETLAAIVMRLNTNPQALLVIASKYLT
jgi:hypothetical protein